MAFNPTVENLWLEVQAALAETKLHTDSMAQILKRMVGRHYRTDNTGVEPDPENFAYAYMANMLPILGIDNPEVNVEAARVIGHLTVAQAIEDGEDAWVRDQKYLGTLQPVLVDFMLARGVLLHYLDEDRRFSRGTVTPRVKRIDPRRFFQDALADSADDDAFRGHWYWEDLVDLQTDPNVRPEALERLTAGEDGGEAVGQGVAFTKRGGNAVGRERIKCYSVWSRERNTIRVLAQVDQTIELYPERPYYGPPSGPYQLFDCYPVSGQPWPLAPLVATEDQSLDLNVHARSMGRAASRRRSIGLVEANNPDLGEKLANAEDGEILPVKGITGQFAEITVGGVDKDRYGFTEYLRSRLERNAGLTATTQGNVGQADTATEAKIADDAFAQRVLYLKNRILDATAESLDKVGWYLFHTEGIVIPVNRRDSYSGEVMEGLFFGGPSPTDAGATWDDFDIRVRFNTLQQSAVARQNLLAYFEQFMRLAQVAPTMPWIRVMNIARDLAEAFQVPDKTDEWMIPELFGAFSQPPQFPPSFAMGGREVPPRPHRRLSLETTGLAAEYAGPETGDAFGSPDNQVTAAGRVAGPRPTPAGMIGGAA